MILLLMLLLTTHTSLISPLFKVVYFRFFLFFVLFLGLFFFKLNSSILTVQASITKANSLYVSLDLAINSVLNLTRILIPNKPEDLLTLHTPTPSINITEDNTNHVTFY